jgi:hypothetical protein
MKGQSPEHWDRFVYMWQEDRVSWIHPWNLWLILVFGSLLMYSSNQHKIMIITVWYNFYCVTVFALAVQVSSKHGHPKGHYGMTAAVKRFVSLLVLNYRILCLLLIMKIRIRAYMCKLADDSTEYKCAGQVQVTRWRYLLYCDGDNL